MKFSTWFRLWCLSFFKILTVNRRRQKSDKQREKERERRRRQNFASPNRYYPKKQRHRRKRRRSGAAQNEKLIESLFGFIAVSLGVLLLPFGLLDWGAKSAKVRREARSQSRAKISSSNPKNTKNNKVTRTSASSETKGQKSTRDPSGGKAAKVLTSTQPESFNIVADRGEKQYFGERLYDFRAVNKDASSIDKSESGVDTPKSMPINEKDQYIRKRMIIDRSRQFDGNDTAILKLGDRFELLMETTPSCEVEVALIRDGERIGYVPNKDKAAYLTCLKIGRKVYGVITAVENENGEEKYEFETWFYTSC